MASNGIKIRIWCEDREQESFALRLLCGTLHIDRRAISFQVSPTGKGAASGWVLRRYHEHVLPSYRRERHQTGLGFIVMIDGDNMGFDARRSQLESVPREQGDRIALLVPTWSIETWVLFLNGERVTEEESMKHRLPPSDFRLRLGTAIDRWDAKKADGSDVLPSLAAAREELRDRLPSPKNR